MEPLKLGFPQRDRENQACLQVLHGEYPVSKSREEDAYRKERRHVLILYNL